MIHVVAVENDRQPRSSVILTGLKTLFQKQLPKMPREYIARLVYDSNSKCLAIIKRGYKVVGGICYRPFPHRGFAEIVFFATASIDQVKVRPHRSHTRLADTELREGRPVDQGYGGMLMDHYKAHIRKTYPEMLYFLTYADNYAVGYFRKQGFSKEITLDRAVWAGYIKDYEGGTIMQCKMLPKVDYLSWREITQQQREAVLSKIREKSRSHIVYEGLPQFQGGVPEGAAVDPKDVPGLRESGWTPSMQTTCVCLNMVDYVTLRCVRTVPCARRDVGQSIRRWRSCCRTSRATPLPGRSCSPSTQKKSQITTRSSHIPWVRPSTLLSSLIPSLYPLSFLVPHLASRAGILTRIYAQTSARWSTSSTRTSTRTRTRSSTTPSSSSTTAAATTPRTPCTTSARSASSATCASR